MRKPGESLIKRRNRSHKFSYTMADLDVAANFKANKAFLASICSYFVANFMKTMIVTFTKDGKLVLIPKKLSIIITKNKMLR